MVWSTTKKTSKPRYANKWISIKKKVRQNFIVGQPLVAWWPSWPPLSSVRYYPSIIIIIRGNFTFFFSQPAGQTRWIIIPTPTVSKKTLTFFAAIISKKCLHIFWHLTQCVIGKLFKFPSFCSVRKSLPKIIDVWLQCSNQWFAKTIQDGNWTLQ